MDYTGAEWRFADQGMGGPLCFRRCFAALQPWLDDVPKGGAVDGVEEIVDVQLQVPAAPLPAIHLSDEGCQAMYGSVSAFALAVGVTVVNECWLPDRLQLRHQPVVHYAVCKVWRVDLAGLWPGCYEARAGACARCVN